MYALEWRTISALKRGLFWCLFPELRSNEGNKHQNNARVSPQTVHQRVHTLFYFLHDITNAEITIKTTIFTHRPRISLAQFSLLITSQSIADLMTSQWPDKCDAITWIVISNSLDIDFIHGDIHGRSCKKTHIHFDIMLLIYNRQMPCSSSGQKTISWSSTSKNINQMKSYCF